jgi:hypothetical protein
MDMAVGSGVHPSNIASCSSSGSSTPDRSNRCRLSASCSSARRRTPVAHRTALPVESQPRIATLTSGDVDQRDRQSSRVRPHRHVAPASVSADRLGLGPGYAPEPPRLGRREDARAVEFGGAGDPARLARSRQRAGLVSLDSCPQAAGWGRDERGDRSETTNWPATRLFVMKRGERSATRRSACV